MMKNIVMKPYLGKRYAKIGLYHQYSRRELFAKLIL